MARLRVDKISWADIVRGAKAMEKMSMAEKEISLCRTFVKNILGGIVFGIHALTFAKMIR
ncbi:MAG: hypothetical protein G01um101430_15 [Parcubacteria group bacterium Gr01-1014_30]|nr:MAG: hypothetical protein G01um101430_15 [Parcubacteria group bacterium Gr01-1014_30]